MTSRTAEQSKSEYINAMGDELGEVYSALWQELARLNQKWLQYVRLFGTSPERIKLLNTVAPQITFTIQKSLWLDVVLHIARLADSAVTGKGAGEKKNLSFKRLKKIIEKLNTNEELDEQWRTLESCCEFAIDWRHRAYAHKDLDIATGKNCTPLKPATRAKVKDALTSMTALMNFVAKKHQLPTTLFDADGTGAGADAERFLYILKHGLTFEQRLTDEVLAGKTTWKEVHKSV
jgi:hypothetical protein